MSKILVLYYSTYGHIETMAQAVAEGTGGDGSRQSSANELAGARFQGKHIAEVANKLFG
jgi:flavodoxin